MKYKMKKVSSLRLSIVMHLNIFFIFIYCIKNYTEYFNDAINIPILIIKSFTQYSYFRHLKQEMHKIGFLNVCSLWKRLGLNRDDDIYTDHLFEPIRDQLF